jgi:hypothetical protein
MPELEYNHCQPLRRFVLLLENNGISKHHAYRWQTVSHIEDITRPSLRPSMFLLPSRLAVSTTYMSLT